MHTYTHRINRNMITGWLVIVGILLITYIGEVIKGARMPSYLFIFAPIATIPLVLVFILYLRKPDWKLLCYFIVAGYFVMYIFVMLTDSTNMVFSYILPMLSLLVLYHHPDLIVLTGAASMLINLASIFQKLRIGMLDASNTKDAEIQISLIMLCFVGSYVAARLYDDITKQNETQNKQIQDMTIQTITAIANTLDAKDSYTEGHSERVSIYSAQLARGLGMSEEETENIRFVALLHDIGKIGVPDSVLKKKGRLSDEEFDLMKQHTVIGGEIIKDIAVIPGIVIGARYHHERYDGKGYPEGLKGEKIPYIARIIAVADSYDAMTSNRVYRKHLTDKQVLSELENGTGTQFDPAIAHKMLELLRMGIIKNLSPDMAGEKR